MAALGDEIVRLGSGRSIQYALRDTGRGLVDIPVYRIAADGTIRRLGVLIPVCPSGFVMRRKKTVGACIATTCPGGCSICAHKGFLGRAYAEHHAAALGLPPNLAEWSEAHMLRALVAHGEDVVGNLLLGDIAREHFINSPLPVAVDYLRYPELAESAESGEVPGSSAGGEQPKFTAYTGQHVIVKFTSAENNPLVQRWRDLLVTEHVAAEVLFSAGVQASRSRLIDIAGRRFLEVERFDRVGAFGRRALHSLASVEAEFVGDAQSPWPVLSARLAAQGIITEEAAAVASLLEAPSAF